MNKKRGLGRGLEALFPTEEKGAPDGRALQELPVDRIFPGPSRLRAELDQERLRELADSIAQLGVVQPIVVRPADGGNYQLVAGQRRWEACRSLGLATIPAVIRESSDLEAAAVALIENVQREDLNPMEEAEAYHRLVEDYGLTQEEVARQVGKSRPLVGNTIRLLALPGPVKKLVRDGTLSAGHGRTILALGDPEQMILCAAQMVKTGMSVREAEEYVKKLLQAASGPAKEEVRRYRDPVIQEMEKNLVRRLQSRVRIREEKGGGLRLEISFTERDRLWKMVEQLLDQDVRG
ncbi:MAG TPA: ParB/RepB/Spo0J family partition protein [Spirochaetia bacterium]|nr:ParB/RepB/Spo0J family partition protein [Spirochaetia bacterium]